jgi:DNA-binding transcriptional LysR family regulator
MDFDLRLLRHCRALAEEGNFARAARTLHITQPALSRSIRDLEHRIGIQVFDRARSRVVPTDLGRVFLDRAGELLGQAELLEREVALLRGSDTGALNVGSGTFPTVLFMAPAMTAFMAENAGVGVRVVNDNWASLIAMLRRRELDLVVAAAPSPSDATDLEVTPLSTRQGFFIVRPNHPLLGRASPSLADIAAFPIATTARVGPAVAELLRKSRVENTGTRAMPDFGCESFTILKAVTRGTDHVLIATPSIAADELERGELVVLPIVDPRLAAKFAVLRARSRTLPPLAERLVRAIVAADLATAEADRAREAEWMRTFEARQRRKISSSEAPRRRMPSELAVK